MTTLQKIKNLQYFDGLKNLKIVLEEFFSSITALETNSVIVGKSNLTVGQQTSGNLIIGNKYLIRALEPGDDFSNVGYVADDIIFIATGTTPTSWSNSTEVNIQEGTIDIFFNDVDLNLETYINLNTSKLTFKITNNKFLNSKTFPYLEGSAVDSLDTNTITFSTSNTLGYFKIEVYN